VFSSFWGDVQHLGDTRPPVVAGAVNENRIAALCPLAYSSPAPGVRSPTLLVGVRGVKQRRMALSLNNHGVDPSGR
jgi:hypothetical protein